MSRYRRSVASITRTPAARTQCTASRAASDTSWLLVVSVPSTSSTSSHTGRCDAEAENAFIHGMIPAETFFMTPLADDASTTPFTPVGRVDDVPAGEGRTYEVAGRLV